MYKPRHIKIAHQRHHHMSIASWHYSTDFNTGGDGVFGSAAALGSAQLFLQRSVLRRIVARVARSRSSPELIRLRNPEDLGDSTAWRTSFRPSSSCRRSADCPFPFCKWLVSESSADRGAESGGRSVDKVEEEMEGGAGTETRRRTSERYQTRLVRVQL